MAVAIRGTTPASTGVVTTDPISVSLTGSRQPQTDDVLVIIHCNDFYASSTMPTPTVGGSSAGVTAITGGTADNGTNEAHIKSYTKVVASTGDLTVAVDTTGPADEEKALIVYVLSGVDTATPIDIAGASFNTGGSTHICPSVSPTSSDAFLICHTNTGNGASSLSYTPPGSMTDQYDTAAGGMSMAGATEQLSASGATGTRTFTPASSVSVNGEVSIAVKTGGAAAAPGSSYVMPRLVLPGRISPDGRVYMPGIRFGDSGGAAPATSAPAGLADGTGSALQPSVALGTVPGSPSGAGSALQPAVKVSPSAGVASGSGTALQLAVKVAPNAGTPVAAGSAPQPEAGIGAKPGVGAGTGSAPQPTITTGADTFAAAGLTTAAGTALQATTDVDVEFTVGVATGTAGAATPSVGARPGIPTAIGAASGTTVQTTGSTNAPAGLAAGTGTAGQPAAAVKANAGAPAGAGTALQPTVSISGSTNALAGLAAATGTAGQPAIAIKANTAAPTGAGSALAATIRTGKVALAGIASAVGSAFTALARITARPPAAGGLGEALQPTTTAEVIARLRTLALYSSRVFGADGYRVGENQTVFLPNNLRTGAPLVVVCHGTAAEASWYYGTEERWRPLEAIADTGMVVVAGDLGEPAVPDGWGNDISVARVDEVITWAASEFGCATDRVSFLGDSAGGATALNWARQNTAQIAGIALRAGVADVDAVYTSNAFLATLIDQAYGGNWAASKATHDPALNTAELVPLADRIRCYYTSGDDLIPPASTLAFCTDVGCAAVPIGDFPHSDQVHTSIPAGDLASWLWSLH